MRTIIAIFDDAVKRDEVAVGEAGCCGRNSLRMNVRFWVFGKHP
jgi:hypothetical protein